MINGVEASSAPNAAATTENGDEKTAQESVAKTQKKKKDKTTIPEDTSEKKATPDRFILFVGNLPYDASKEQIEAHFSKISPSSVRLATNKGTKKSKGFAFLEFDHYDKMKTCLKLYHHSIFGPEAKEKGGKPTDRAKDDEEEQTRKGEQAQKGRRINVELTVGGGGKGKERNSKIKSKNQRLEEERERRRIKEKAEREQAGPKKKGPPETGANATAVDSKDARGDIHPSRLARVSH